MSINDPILLFIALLWGVAAAYIQERFGVFDDLDPKTKQLVNALVSYVVPAVTAFVTGIFGLWPEQLGTPETFTLAVVSFVAPVVVWLISQVAHQVDRLLQGTGDRVTGKPVQ